MTDRKITQVEGEGRPGEEESVRPRLPSKFVPPRITTYKAEDLEKRSLVIHAGSDPAFGRVDGSDDGYYIRYSDEYDDEDQ